MNNDNKPKVPNIREIIKQAVNAHKEGLTPEEIDMQEKAMIDIFENGLLPGEALGFNREFTEYVYKYAYILYQKNKIIEAAQLFRWLITMVPTELKYKYAFIHCLIQQKHWQGAVEQLLLLGEINRKDPYPYEKICDCLIEANDFPGALLAIEQAIIRAGDNATFAQDKEKWVMTYDYVLSQLNIDPSIIEKVRAEKKAKASK